MKLAFGPQKIWFLFRSGGKGGSQIGKGTGAYLQTRHKQSSGIAVELFLCFRMGPVAWLETDDAEATMRCVMAPDEVDGAYEEGGYSDCDCVGALHTQEDFLECHC